MKTRCIVAVALCVCLSQAATATTTWHVAPPPLGSDLNPGSQDQPFATIQKGIDSASDGDTVIVAEGTYVENIMFWGKNMVLRSTDPLNSEVVAKTIIDGDQAGSVVTFLGIENETCVLSGFTIRNGKASYGGGIYAQIFATGATIQGNIITSSSADYGGGIYNCGGIISNNVITGNSARFGGGLAYCHGIVRSNTITANSSSGSEGGGGLYDCQGTIRNCIIWGNAPARPQLYDSAIPTYSCIQEWTGTLQGNIGYHPYFTDADNGDFHLKSWSPCIDAGDPSSDFSNEPQPNGGRINMGAYGNTPEAASKSPDIDADELPDDWETEFFGDLAQGAEDDHDGDRYSNLWEYRWGLDPNVKAAMPGIWHVDASVETPGDGTTWDRALRTIQEGIEAAPNGETVIVAQGTYVENIQFNGKNIALASTDPFSSEVVAGTIIDGDQRGAVVTFSGTEDETCVLSGFTIRNGSADYGGGICGGTGDKHTHAAIQSNVISGNSANSSGGGLYRCDGTIQNNTIYANSACYYGGGLYGCSGTIQNNVITGNCATGCMDWGNGGGLAVCNGTIQNNTIYANSADNGGGLYGCGGTIRNNTITGNSADYGGGLYHCDGSIQNNTIADNSARYGGGLYECDGTICNCVIWGNTGGQVSGWSLPTFSCVENWTGGGEGSIAFSPYFVDPEGGDFHLESWSPCIDAGDPASPFSEEPEPNGGRINIGAYGNTSEAASKSPDMDSDGLPDDWEMHWFGDLSEDGDGDADSDGISNITEYIHATNPTSPAEQRVTNTTKGIGYLKIQDALSACDNGDELVVYPGVYPENIHFKGKNVILTSTDPLDADVVANTIIDGNPAAGRDSVVTFSGAEDESCVLAGLTIRNGKAPYGGGICGGTEQTHSRATVQNNIITGNSASGDSGGGGGLAFCDGTIQNNTVSGNSASGDYGVRGGGLYDCDGTVANNIISGNRATGWGCGGGLCDCGGTIQNNIITDNSADVGSGGLCDCHGTIRNNMVSHNNSGWVGGGLSNCDGVIQNNTIACNAGGGLDRCDGTIRNCIIWGNSGGQVYDSSLPGYSCVENWAGGGEGNMAFEPYFLDAENGDFHLKSWSPCIDAGDPTSDFSNEPEPNAGRVNMGAYGNTPEAACKSADDDSDGLPDDWEVLCFGDLGQSAAGDPDGDRIPNMTEYRYAWDPRTASETLVENLTKGAHYQTIQAALSECDHGDEIVVYPGLYKENIHFGGKNIVLTSTDPLNSDIVAKTIIDGKQSGSVVTFLGTENETCVLSGFTICNGSASNGGGICGKGTLATIGNNVITENSSDRGGGLSECRGAVQNNIITANSGSGVSGCNGTVQNSIITGNSAGGLRDCNGTIENNTISANSGGGLAFCDGTIQNNTIYANSGGGLYRCDGTIQNNIISGNSGSEGGGGGLYGCQGIIRNNRISGNQAQVSGGGLYDCNGIIRNNIIHGNSAGDKGGGLYQCDGTIQNNTIYGNLADEAGGGLAYSDGTIENNTIYGNSAEAGGGVYGSSGTIRNCIIWRNAAQFGEQVYLCTKPAYSCIQDWTEDGEGNIAFNPYFVDPEGGSFRLWSWSPCIDAGDPSSDFSNEPQPNGGRINMGAYGNTPEAACKSPDSDNDGLPDDWEMQFFGDLTPEVSDDPDGDLVSNIEEYRRGLDPKSPIAWWHVDCLVGSSGDGTSWETAFKTIQEAIDVAPAGSIISVAEGIYVGNIQFKGQNIVLRSTDPLNPDVVANTVLDGNQSGPVVTFSGGKDEICVLAGFTIQNGSAATGGGICGNGTNATIRNNVITGNCASYGGGVHGCNGIIENNGLFGNSARYGGGLAECAGAIRGNTIRGNAADMYGGGLARCHGTIEDNIITGNSAGMYGGGLYGCQGTIECNTITANSADHGGGGLDFCCGIIRNNVIAGNWATWNGGGLYACDGTILNNTIFGNLAGYCGGGLDYCCGTIQNCIIWANHASRGAQLYDSTEPTYSCIQDWTSGGVGNISLDPQFRDAENGDFRLLPISPCIDAGSNSAPDLHQTDIAGRPRIIHGGLALTVDMGAYEFYIIPIEVDDKGDVILTWDSLAGKTYSVYHSTDMTTWQLAADDIPSAGNGITSWTDDGSKTGLPPSLAPRRFYRVLENP